MQKTALYIHWPFCASKCPYCDFNSHVSDNIDHGEWRAGYLEALAYYVSRFPDRQIVSIYFGGGTPSLMEPETVLQIIDFVQKNWKIANDIEITLEGNPTSVETSIFREFRAAGVNRISLGVQALNDKTLAFLGRQHSVVEALQAVDIAKEIFDRVSFDLIYARPKQTLADWEAELSRAVVLADGHLSLYQLTIERNTPFHMSHARGEFSLPKQEFAADFYDLTQDILEAEGLPGYEVSNHARTGVESIHNLMYWTYEDYIGIGPGAHGRVSIGGQKHATRAHSSPQIWREKLAEYGQSGPGFEALSENEESLERLMMGLRLRSGIPVGGVSDILDHEKLGKAVEQGWIVLEPDGDGTDVIRTTREGMLRLNALIDFVTG